MNTILLRLPFLKVILFYKVLCILRYLVSGLNYLGFIVVENPSFRLVLLELVSLSPRFKD